MTARRWGFAEPVMADQEASCSPMSHGATKRNPSGSLRSMLAD